VDGTVILYADQVTDSIRKALEETNRRRSIQKEFNRENNITPETIRKSFHDALTSLAEQDYVTVEVERPAEEEEVAPELLPRVIEKLRKQMFEAARDLEFEKAADLRDRVRALEKQQLRYA